MTNNQQVYGFGLTAILFWSTAAVAFKIALSGISFVALLLYSSGTASVVLLVIAMYQRKLPILRTFKIRDWLKVAGAGFLNPFGYYMVLLYAYSVLPAQIAQPLNYTWPIMLVLLSVPLLGQKLSYKSFFAILVSFAGVFVISAQGELLNYKLDPPMGVLMATGSSIIWALFWIVNLRNKHDEVIKLMLNFFFGFVYTAVAVALFFEIQTPSLKSILASIYVGFFEMGFTFVLWLMALKHAKSNARISNLVFISPFLSLGFIWLILGEQIHTTTFAGLVLIIVGIFIQQSISNKKKSV